MDSKLTDGEVMVQLRVARCSVTRAWVRVWIICVRRGLRSTPGSGFGQFRRQHLGSELIGGTGTQGENFVFQGF